MQGKYWCFTINNPGDDPDPANIAGCTLMVFQHEIGEAARNDRRAENRVRGDHIEEGVLELGTPHIQGYVEFQTNKRLNAIQALFERGTHFELRRGTRAQAVTYCTKDNTRDPAANAPVYFPDEAACLIVPNQGRRNDIHEYTAAIIRGDSNEQLLQTHSVMMLKYSKGTEFVRAALPAPAYIEHPRDSICYWGPSHTGKTYKLLQECPEGPEWFWASPMHWFDGYDGEPGIVFNEIRDSWYKWRDILRVLDNAPRRMQKKGSTVRLTAYRFRFSTNVHPKKWYKNTKTKPNSPWLTSPFRNRFSEIILMDQRVDAALDPEVIDLNEPDSSDEEPIAFPGAPGQRWDGQAWQQ